MSQRAVGRDRTRRARLVRGDKERARTEQETANFMREMEKIDYLHRPRTKRRLREAFGDVLVANVSQAIEGNKTAERILIGHRREMERINRESTREAADIDRNLTETDKLLASENEGLTLLKKRKDRMEKEGQPTEIVEGQIVESSRRIFQLDQHRNTLIQKRSRLTEDTARERTQALEDVQAKLKEAK